MIEYSHDIHKFAELGLQLNLPPDLIPANQYFILDNAVSRIEGRIDTRDGITALFQPVPATPIHTIFRLAERITGVATWRLIGVGTSLYYADVADNIPHLLSSPASFDGTPLSIMSFRFDGDPQSWAIISNGAKMVKVKPGYTQQLGLPAPVAASQPLASVGGAGTLTGSYTWEYTYVNTVTLSESDPSLPSKASGGISGQEIKRPTTFTNPATVPSFSHGGDAASNPGNAFDGNNATFSQMLASGPSQRSSCQWQGIPAGSQYTSVALHIIASWSAGGGGNGSYVLVYSPDNGTTWNNIGLTGGSTATEYIINLPAGQDLTSLIVSAQFINHVNGAGNLSIYEIWTVGVLAGGSGGSLLALTAQSAVICVVAPTDAQETAIRLYRIGGTLTDAYRMVSQSLVSALAQGACGAGFLEIDDNISDTTLAASNILNFDNDMPVTSVQVTNQTLKAIWGFDDRVLGCGDPNRAESVYFSKRGNADEWPPQNWLVVGNSGDEIMNGLVYALRCFAFGRERLYTIYTLATSLPSVLQGGSTVAQGATFASAETSCRRGLKGRWAFATGKKGIYFCAKDGIFRTNGGPEESVTDDSIRPLFPTREGPGRDTGSYIAPDLTNEDGLRMAFHNNEIWFDYTGLSDQLRHRLIYDEDKNRWRSENYATAMQMAYSEPETVSSLLSGDIQGNVQQGTGTLEGNVNVHLRTGAFDQGKPLNLKEYGNVIFDLDPNGATVTITPYVNGNALAELALTVTGTGRQRVPLALTQPSGEIFALNISFDVTWTATPSTLPVLYQFDILYRLEPAAMRHWEVPPNSLRIQGWFHVRDAYVTLRSAANVTLTFTPDNGAVQTFIITSTGGAKQKVYIPFAANKERLAQFSFDSNADFRLYADECELRCKQWLTKLGYAVVPLFGLEQP